MNREDIRKIAEEYLRMQALLLENKPESKREYEMKKILYENNEDIRTLFNRFQQFLSKRNVKMRSLFNAKLREDLLFKGISISYEINSEGNKIIEEFTNLEWDKRR